MSEQPLPAELTALENALAGLTPAPAVFDRDRLMFRAGQAAGRARGWPWPAATAALALVAAGLGLALALRPTGPPVERYIYVRVTEPARVVPPPVTKPVPPAVTEPSPAPPDDYGPSPTAYLRLQNQLLRWGLDSLPTPPPGPSAEPPLTRARLLDRPVGASQGLWFLPFRTLSAPGDAS